MTTVNVKITRLDDNYVYFQEIDGNRIKEASGHSFPGDSAIAMRSSLQGACPGMTMEIDIDFQNYAYAPIRGARLLKK